MFARVGMLPVVPLLSFSLFVVGGSHTTVIKHVIFYVTFKSLGCSDFRLSDLILCFGQPKLQMDLLSKI